MSELLPSTQRLFAVLGYDMEAILSKSQSARDPYPVYYALTSWEDDLFERIGPEKYEHAPWPATQEELDALRNALADQRGNSAGEELAYILVRCGCRQPETLATLCAWDAQLFRWSTAGYTAQDLLAKFQAAGVAGVPNDADLRQFNRWLADLGSALGYYSGGALADTLLKEKVFYFTLDSDFHDEEYAELFLGLAKHANPPLVISAISRSVSDDETCVVKYVLDGVESSFVTDKFYHPIEDCKVVQAFNDLLKSRGRRTMAFRFGSGRAEPYDAASYIVAEPELFVGLCMELGIPLHDYSGSRSEVGA